MRHLVVWLLLAVTGPFALAGEHRAERGAGFVAGALGGIGFGYRTFDERGWGWQVGGLAGHDTDETIVILGAQRMKTLSVSKKSRFYALAGAMAILDREEVWVTPMRAPAPGSPPVFMRQKRDDSSFNAGAGLGISLGKSEGVVLAVELPLVFEFQSGLKSIAPIPQVALIYNF